MADTTLRDTLRLAEDDIGAGRPEDALKHCHHILAHYPEMLEARRVLGEAYLALRKTREAYQAFDRVLVSDPENTLAYCGRALINQQVGDLDSALDCYYQACELSLGNRQLRQEFRRLARQANQPDFVLSRVGLARLYMRGDLLAHAIREWEQVLQGDPERVDARLGLAEALWRDGQPERAARQCHLILQAIPSCLKAVLLLGEIAYCAGQSSAANQYVEQARRQDPDGRMAHELFADALLSDEAFAAFILAEPARIPIMVASPGELEIAQPSALAVLLRSGETSRSDTGASPGAAEERGVPTADDVFSFSFLQAETPVSSAPLREGESLEEMLAALIERPILPDALPASGAVRARTPPSPPADQLEALLQSFSHPEDQAPPPAAASQMTGASGSALAASSNFAEAFSWLETTNRPAAEPETAPPSVEERLAALAQQSREAASPPLFMARRVEDWPEEDTEAGWVRWLQAQGAQSLDVAEGQLEDTGPFAALLRPPRQETTLWEAPDAEFARSFWPSDTVPQPAVRLTPGSTGRAGGAMQRQVLRGISQSDAQEDALPNRTDISSVSLRPLTLEELERSFSASGLKRLEGTLAALASETDAEPGGPPDKREGMILTLAEDDYAARLELAEHQRKMGRIDEALGHYRAVLRGAPALIDTVINELQAITREGPDRAAAFRLLGDAYTRRGKYMEALEAYNRGLAASRGY